MKYLVFICFLMLTLTFCSQKQADTSKQAHSDSVKNAENNSVPQEIKTKDPVELTIDGKDIWIRDKPKTGAVIMKLNTGDKCEILEKGNSETIKDKTDFWYKIKFNEKEGWVFGSQTSLKQTTQTENNLMDKDEFLKIYKAVALAMKQSKYSIVNQYVHPEFGIFKLDRPGTTDNVTRQNQFNEELLRPDQAGLVNTICDLKFESLPKFTNDCKYNKQGCFSDKVTGLDVLSKTLVSVAKMAEVPVDNKELALAKKAEGKINQVVIQTNEFINLYFGKVDGKWYFIAFSFINPCDA